ncbi:PucR family transcriptional regulator [Paenibacillus sp. GCM10027626]|uniref:PucR family transcriptional regulator n=1 Tax=Paenibacillus sp. GCM10027626 TaxID=3273411 RepID=UPI00363E9519
MVHEHNPFDRSFESVEALADMVSEVLHNPVTIEDDKHRLIAYSSHDSQADEVRVATIIGRRVPEKVISTLWEEGVMQRVLESEEPVSLSAIPSIGLGDRLVIAIRKQRTILGFIWVLEENRPLGGDAADMLKKAARAASAKLLQLQLKRHKETKGHEDFFWQLLTGHLKKESDIAEKSAAFGLELPSRYQIVVLEFESDIGEKQQQIEYMLTTAPRLRIVFHTLHHNRLILLSGLTKHDGNKEYFAHFQYVFEQMQQRFGFSPSGGGSGSVYAEYIMAERSYQEALSVLKIKRRFPCEIRDVYYYPDLGYYRLLPAMLVESSIHAVENRCLQKLSQYDQEHNGELQHTLEVFLASDSNVKKTAEALHVHINTLSYRLKRIAEIGEIDLDDMDQKVTVFLDLRMRQLSGGEQK